MGENGSNFPWGNQPRTAPQTFPDPFSRRGATSPPRPPGGPVGVRAASAAVPAALGFIAPAVRGTELGYGGTQPSGVQHAAGVGRNVPERCRGSWPRWLSQARAGPGGRQGHSRSQRRWRGRAGAARGDVGPLPPPLGPSAAAQRRRPPRGRRGDPGSDGGSADGARGCGTAAGDRLRTVSGGDLSIQPGGPSGDLSIQVGGLGGLPQRAAGPALG